MTMFVVILLLAVFFAMNMGGATFASAFGTAYGSRIMDQRKAALLYVFFVVLGAVTVGDNVAQTLRQDVIDPRLLTNTGLLIFIAVSGLSMYAANAMNIPQSTSIVTVAAIAGIGAKFGEVQVDVIQKIVPFWMILPVISYFLTRVITSLVYPIRPMNFWIYERFINHEHKLRTFVIVSCCYNAFSIGTNNVANVVGPMSASFYTGNIVLALMVFGVIYASGGFVFTGPLKTVGKNIVPLGLLTASIISLVSGTLMIVASIFGIPQSFVMLQVAAVFAVASLKDGDDIALSNPVMKKTFFTWSINPMITFLVAYFLSWMLL